MISTQSLLYMGITTLLCFITPVVLWLIVRKNTKRITGAVFAGVLGFFIMQIVIRIPILQMLLPKFQWFQDLAKSIWLYALFLGITAGLFEESGRLLVYILLLKDRYSWKTGIASGIGHGGIEAVMLIGMTYISNIVISIMLNNGSGQTLLKAQGLDESSISQIITALRDTDSSLFLVAGVERVLTIVIHIAISVLILQGIMKGKTIVCFIIGVLMHTILDAGAVLFTANGASVWVVELYVFIFALISVVYIFMSKKQFGNRINPPIDDAEKAIEEGY